MTTTKEVAHRVTPRTFQQIQEDAHLILNLHSPKNLVLPTKCNVDLLLDQMSEHFGFDLSFSEGLARNKGLLGCCYVDDTGKRIILLDSDVYFGIRKRHPYCMETGLHEGYHAWRHLGEIQFHRIKQSRWKASGLPSFEMLEFGSDDPEWQAVQFELACLIPLSPLQNLIRQIEPELALEGICSVFGVERSQATRRVQSLVAAGMLKSVDEIAMGLFNPLSEQNPKQYSPGIQTAHNSVTCCGLFV